jgi:hypothetical protein
VDADVLADVEAIARREGSALSAAVTAALARDLRRRRLQEIIARYEAEHGEISDEELAKARRAWRG